MVWRNTAHSEAKKQRILLHLNQIKSIAVKSDGKSFLSNAFTSPRLIIYLNEMESESDQQPVPSQQLYIQLAFKNGKDSRNLFAQKLQELIASKLLNTQNEDEKQQAMDQKYEELQHIIFKENIIDEIHEQYIKITVAEFASAIQALYFIQGHSAYQKAEKIQMIRNASEVITRVVRYDDNTHHLKLKDSDKRIICDSYYDKEPYLEISSPGQLGASYTSYHVGRFLDINTLIFRLFKRIYPIKVSLKVQQKWIETLLRCTWYYRNDDTQKIIGLIDMLVNEIWNVKFVPLNDVNFNDKTDLCIIKHILSNYCHPENIPINCHLKDLVDTFVANESKENYEQYLIEILNIKALEKRFTAESAHKVMVDLVTRHKYTKQDFVIREMIAFIKRKNIKLSESEFLHLQRYMKGVIDEDEAMQIIELNLMINDRLIALKVKGKYNGLNALQYANSKEVKPMKIVQFLKARMEFIENELDPSGDDGDDQKFYCDENMEIVDLNADDDNDGGSANREDLKNIMKVMSGLQKELNDVKKANESICSLQQKIYAEITKMNAMNEENKVNVDEELEKCDKQLVIDRKWREWTSVEIVDYIINLQDGRYSKYKSVLFEKMKYREMNGSDLEMLEKTDLSNFFGIINFGDICSLYNEIQALISTETEEQNEEN